MSIAKRIALMVVLAAIGLVVVGANAILGLGRAQARFEYVQDSSIPSVRTLNEASVAVQQLRIAVRDHVLAQNETDRKTQEGRLEELRQTVDKRFETYEKNLLSDETDRQMVQKDKDAWARYLVTVRAIVDRSNAGDAEAVHKLLATTGDFSLTARELTKDLADHMDFNWKQVETLRDRNRADYGAERLLLIAVAGLATLLVAGLGYHLATELGHRLKALGDFIRRVNRSLDFTERAAVTKRDELAQIATTFNELVARLQDNLLDISASVRTVAGAASEMAGTSAQVAGTAQHQSSAASDMAATVEELTVSVNHVADRAQETNNLSHRSGELSADGEKVIDEVSTEIKEIAGTVDSAAEQIRSLEEHSQQIASIVQVIKDVADQTNLLALNAAIEAARAGEQGRGFAVVADEVRKLAERTASSTQEIAQTVEAMRSSSGSAVESMLKVVDKVGRGVDRSHSANSTIKQIGSTSREAVEMVEDIAQAIREQGGAANAIATQVERIAQMSEESSLAASTTAETARKLDELAGHLHGILATYRLG